ncbi:hypothetical protein Dimus_029135, partial [Dionaea muscipula]
MPAFEFLGCTFCLVDCYWWVAAPVCNTPNNCWMLAFVAAAELQNGHQSGQLHAVFWAAYMGCVLGFNDGGWLLLLITNGLEGLQLVPAKWWKASTLQAACWA